MLLSLLFKVGPSLPLLTCWLPTIRSICHAVSRQPASMRFQQPLRLHARAHVHVRAHTRLPSVVGAPPFGPWRADQERQATADPSRCCARAAVRPAPAMPCKNPPAHPSPLSLPTIFCTHAASKQSRSLSFPPPTPDTRTFHHHTHSVTRPFAPACLPACLPACRRPSRRMSAPAAPPRLPSGCCKWRRSRRPTLPAAACCSPLSCSRQGRGCCRAVRVASWRAVLV